MRAGLVTVAVLVASAAVACGDDRPDLVVDGTPPATPYGGPLHLPAERPDGEGARGLPGRAGAAGRALECDGEIYSGGAADPWGRGDGGTTPEEGLRAYFDMDQPGVPRHGYRVERREKGRVLYSFDVDGRTKVAVVVAEDRPGRPGWGPETSASCDPAELPASFTDTQEYEVWTDGDGERVPVARLSSSAGAAHCDWQKAHFLSLGQGEDGRTYARDPDRVLPRGMLTSPYDGDVPLPAGAHDTGYRLRERQLWLTDDPSRVYVRTSRGVEAWPLVKPDTGCK
ncbi:hypothetical protein [Streptomyces sp. NPDC020996]|uniref:hypothetical protein n=1 Tax=Streptomyces sp. NPDC020996 TaxID=3154791 RepID=UPI0033F044D7